MVHYGSALGGGVGGCDVLVRGCGSGLGLFVLSLRGVDYTLTWSLGWAL